MSKKSRARQNADENMKFQEDMKNVTGELNRAIEGDIKPIWEIAGEAMGFKKGAGGRPRVFSSPQEMWEIACDYFAWQTKDILYKNVANSKTGGILSLPQDKPFTLAGLRLFAGIGVQTWYDYCAKPEFSEVTKAIDDILFKQKFDGASAGMFNANIIARDLGLAEKQDISAKVESKVIKWGDKEVEI